jgi:hypothetical protein
MTRQFTLTIENSDLSAEQLEELFADALDGELPVDENAPIVVSVEDTQAAGV